MATEPSPVLKDYFKQVSGSDLSDWDQTAETQASRFTLRRIFEHRATKDKVDVTETVKYNQLDEMEVTYIKLDGSFKGNEIKGTLIWKPTID